MKQFVLITLIFFVFGCKQNPPEPTELYNKYRNSVALIQNSYYFKTTLDNGFEFFYTIENNKPVFFDEEHEAIENAGISYGTGFFISEKGELATNRHVVYPNKENELVGEGINDYLNDLRYKIKKAINEKETEQSKLIDVWNEYYDYLDYDKKIKIKNEYSETNNDLLEFEQLLEKLDFNPDNTITELKRVFLGIAFDDTHVTSINDFKECVAIKKAREEEVDLAIIQLKDKTTPTKIKNTFSLKNINGFEPLKLNDAVYMIGFNHGISLANTRNGIKSQFTQGTITQDPDNNRVLYSIPTLPGSSGSPIIDKWGNLVAVNFAKTGDFQGFSFGIPYLALTNLYNDQSNIVTSDYSISNTTAESNKNIVSNNYENIIREFLRAEEQRDFNKIYSFLSPKFSRYYDINKPNYSNLKKRYEYLWGFVSNSRNYIKSIEKINEYTYDLNTNYKYYNERKKKEFSVNSTVRFLFDSNGKVIETYGIE
ncbi:S1 family peptidase [Lacinutrix himadriensis]|uniref:S1 family peptidase n=1 Tax=Lacinutrix himadriensis TaxID=641549 RepID=UPI0006E45717|nr:serine protease [Lacinutrix himadriensis]